MPSSDLALELCGLASVDFFLFASLDMAVGLRMVNFVYFTGGWLTQLTPTMDEDIGPKGVGEGRLAAVELVGEWEETEVVVEEPVEFGLCFPIRIFSTVKLEIVLLLDVFCSLGAVFLMMEDLHSVCSDDKLTSSFGAFSCSVLESPSPTTS